MCVGRENAERFMVRSNTIWDIDKATSRDWLCDYKFKKNDSVRLRKSESLSPTLLLPPLTRVGLSQNHLHKVSNAKSTIFMLHRVWMAVLCETNQQCWRRRMTSKARLSLARWIMRRSDKRWTNRFRKLFNERRLSIRSNQNMIPFPLVQHRSSLSVRV